MTDLLIKDTGVFAKAVQLGDVTSPNLSSAKNGLRLQMRRMPTYTVNICSVKPTQVYDGRLIQAKFAELLPRIGDITYKQYEAAIQHLWVLDPKSSIDSSIKIVTPAAIIQSPVFYTSQETVCGTLKISGFAEGAYMPANFMISDQMLDALTPLRFESCGAFKDEQGHVIQSAQWLLLSANRKAFIVK